jgi:superfamily II DNA or RNA helicase
MAGRTKVSRANQLFNWVCPSFATTVRLTDVVNDGKAFAIHVEQLIPGLRVYRKNARIRDVCVLPVGETLVIKGPIFVQSQFATLATNDLPFNVVSSTVHGSFGGARHYSLADFEAAVSDVANLERIGSECLPVVAPFFKPNLPLHPYQLAAIGLSRISNSEYLVIPPGGGKTRTALVASVARIASEAQRNNVPVSNYTIVVTGPEITWDAWDYQSLDMVPMTHWLFYSNGRKVMRVFKFQAESYRRPSDVTWHQYHTFCKTRNIPPIVYVNDESLPILFNEVSDAVPYPSVIIFDEIHTMSSRERTKVSYDSAGKISFAVAKTATTGQPTRAAARSELSKQASPILFMGLSATPLTDGKHRRVFAPVDLISPYYFGNYGAFKNVFTTAAPDAYMPESDDSYSQNHMLLNNRLKPFLLEISPSTVRQYMPPIQYEARWVNHDAKNPTLIRVEEPDEETKELFDASGSLFEKRLAQACQVKADDLASGVADTCASNPDARILVFVGRKKQVEHFVARIQAAIYHKWRGDMKPSGEQPTIKGLHGDNSTVERREAVNWFKDNEVKNDGPRIIVATYQFMGMSIDGLQCATNMEVAMFPVNPGVWSQLVGRVDRLGGVGCHVRIWLARRTFDETIYARFTSNANSIKETLPTTGAEVALLALNLRDEETYQKLLNSAPFDFSAWESDDD